MNTCDSSAPLHGVTLEMICIRLVEHYGCVKLCRLICINCFKKVPSIKSSPTFLRPIGWARKKVEILYRQTRFPESVRGR